MELVSLLFGLKINRSKTMMLIVDLVNSPEVAQIANCDVLQSQTTVDV